MVEPHYVMHGADPVPESSSARSRAGGRAAPELTRPTAPPPPPTKERDLPAPDAHGGCNKSAQVEVNHLFFYNAEHDYVSIPVKTVELQKELSKLLVGIQPW